MDLVLKLRELRRLSGLSQKDVARMSGVGEKTISSFETGQRIDSLKISQLRRILAVYAMNEQEFFSGALDRDLANGATERVSELVEDLRSLPLALRTALLGKFRLMIDGAATTHPEPRRYSRHDSDWHMLTSRN